MLFVLTFIISLLLPCELLAAYDFGLEVHVLQPMVHAVPGQIATVQVEIINTTPNNQVIVGHVSLPPGWEVIPSNDLFMHIHAGQSAIQTLLIQPPDSACSGEYPLSYEVWKRENMSMVGADHFKVIIPTLPSDEPLLIELTSPALLEASAGEMIYISALAKNSSDDEWEGMLLLNTPSCWPCFPPSPYPIQLGPCESKGLLFAVKVPEDALAGEHLITINHAGGGYCIRAVTVKVKPEIDIKGCIEGAGEAYNLNQTVSFFLRYTNEGNLPLTVRLEKCMDPPCLLQCTEMPFEILPHETKEIPVNITPELTEHPYNQFVLIKLIHAETGVQLYQNPMTFKFVIPGASSNDPYIHIPAYVKGMALRDRYKNILALETAGGGVIDPETGRYFDFMMRLPSSPRHVIYNADQRIYMGLYDPDMDLRLGDTVYELTPLTQFYRYGRGAGIDKRWNDKWASGLHYSQNTLSCDSDPHELAAYVEYAPQGPFSLSSNYLHKVQQGIPTSNLVSLEGVIDYPENITTELEGGVNFLKNKGKGNPYAYRIASYGKLPCDSWYTFEKAYAGSEFYGYYNHLHLLTSSVDFPISQKLRANLNVSRLTQNFDTDCEEEPEAILPKQHQYGATLTYLANENCSFGVNGLLLRGEDLGLYPQYDFYQKWAGVSFFYTAKGYILNSLISWGQQKDYLTDKTTHCLQRYYAYLGKDLMQNLRGFIFYDGGNINYYDAKPWRNGFGGALSYRFAPTGHIDLFYQKLHHTADMLDMSQFACNFNYVFKNLHRIEAIVQVFRYEKHYPNDTLVLFSYSIPLSIPLCKRKDIGELQGYVYNDVDATPIQGALVGCNSNYASTNENGQFTFSGLPKGCQEIEVALLPGDMIPSRPQELSVDIRGGAKVKRGIPVVNSCTLEGEIIKYRYKDLFTLVQDEIEPELIKDGGMSGIRIAASREGEKEIYLNVTGGKGNFSFSKLRPGEWHLKVFTDDLPPLHGLEFNDLVVHLEPGQTQAVHFKVKPLAPQFFKLDSN